MRDCGLPWKILQPHLVFFLVAGLCRASNSLLTSAAVVRTNRDVFFQRVAGAISSWGRSFMSGFVSFSDSELSSSSLSLLCQSSKCSNAIFWPKCKKKKIKCLALSSKIFGRRMIKFSDSFTKFHTPPTQKPALRNPYLIMIHYKWT